MARFSITINGKDISSKFDGRALTISVSDKSGVANDTASISVRDSDDLQWPNEGARIEIALGNDDIFGTVFSGVVDEVTSRGSASGRTLDIKAKGSDPTRTELKRIDRHFDDTTIGDMLEQAAADVGVTIKVDPDLAALPRSYELADGVSFPAFADRLANEVGGVFKLRNGQAVLAKAQSSKTTSGTDMPEIKAQWGVNLQSWEITPKRAVGQAATVQADYYDPVEGVYKNARIPTGADVPIIRRAGAPVLSEDHANQKASGTAARMRRDSARGSVVINGNPAAQAEAILHLISVRPNISGKYRIKSVEHRYDTGGYKTTVQVTEKIG